MEYHIALGNLYKGLLVQPPPLPKKEKADALYAFIVF